MAKINVLPRQVAELIAAGEVVERPASVIKELLENSIDAGATAITVEIQHGGITYMRVTDNGCGIEREDVKTAFLRHATSKVRTENDLNSIGTLGFRGEALAAVSSVAMVELLTCTADAAIGTRYSVNGGIGGETEDAGCPKGTTIIVRDLFYNTPARMKFLKTDVTEANAVSQIVDRIALSHPEISVKFIRDGKQTLSATGDGKLASAVYAVLGRDFFGGLIPCESAQDGVAVSGFVCKPGCCRPNRNGQFFFLNGRLVKSGTATAALEQAYKNSVMVGKFPYCVLNITLPLGTVDVNVHPAKTEVRFSDEKRVFGCIYYAVKNALATGDTRPEIKIESKNSRFQNMTVEQFRQTAISETAEKKPSFVHEASKTETGKPYLHDSDIDIFSLNRAVSVSRESVMPFADPQKKSVPPASFSAGECESTVQKPVSVSKKESETETPSLQINDEPIRYIGEAFMTYIIVQKGDSIYIIDKHAAHERIIFEKLKAETKPEKQLLLSSVSVTLQKEEYNAIIENAAKIEKFGFEIEDFGGSSVLVTAVPAALRDEDVKSVISEIAGTLIETGGVAVERLDDIYHIVACRSAVKAGNISSAADLAGLAERVLSLDDIMYCPHGRPVAVKLTKHEIEKQFGRIQ